MISALEIGIALSLPLLVFTYVALQPKPKSVPVRIPNAEQRRRSNA